MNSDILVKIHDKEKLLREGLQHPLIREVRGKGLMLAIILDSAELATRIIHRCKDKGLILFWLLFEPRAIRITPPLTISEEEIKEGCAILTQVLDEISSKK